MHSKRTWLYLSLILFFTLITLFALNAPDITKKLIAPKDKPDFYFENVKLTEIYRDRINLILNAQYASIDKNKGVTTLKNINSSLFDKKQKIVVLNSKLAKLFSHNSELQLLAKPRADIFIDNRNIKLQANMFSWLPDKEKLMGNGNVKIESGKIRIRGKEFTAKIPLQKIHLKKNCRAVVQLD
ncbi:LPS export ABC transporter periplasmic protein LptC [Candidatus Margulisiibacteriota bacterium]